MSFGTSGVRVLELVFFGLIIGRVAQLLPVFRHLSVGVLCISRDDDYGVVLLGVAVPVSGVGSVSGMR